MLSSFRRSVVCFDTGEHIPAHQIRPHGIPGKRIRERKEEGKKKRWEERKRVPGKPNPVILFSISYTFLMCIPFFSKEERDILLVCLSPSEPALVFKSFKFFKLHTNTHTHTHTRGKERQTLIHTHSLAHSHTLVV